MHFKPLHDRVAIEVMPQEEKTAGGIIIPDTAKEKPTQGKVISVGDGAIDETGKRRPLSVKAGDKVLRRAAIPLAWLALCVNQYR